MASTYSLKEARKIAKTQPTHCMFVQLNDNLLGCFDDDSETPISVKAFKSLIQNSHCKCAYSYNNEPLAYFPEKPKTQAAPEVQDEPTPEEKRDYVLYRYLSEGSDVKQFYFSSGAPYCNIGIDIATLYSEDEATVKYIALAHAGSKGWFCVHRDAFNTDGSFKEAAKETPEAAPAPKKRVAYALCDYIDGEPSYFCAEYAELYIKRSKENIQVFRTKEDAEFYNAIFLARHPNQAEMYVREIEF